MAIATGPVGPVSTGPIEDSIFNIQYEEEGTKTKRLLEKYINILGFL